MLPMLLPSIMVRNYLTPNMPKDDPVNKDALIFSEFDVYSICGYLANIWCVNLDNNDVVSDIEKAIYSSLGRERND